MEGAAQKPGRNKATGGLAGNRSKPAVLKGSGTRGSSPLPHICTAFHLWKTDERCGPHIPRKSKFCKWIKQVAPKKCFLNGHYLGK